MPTAFRQKVPIPDAQASDQSGNIVQDDQVTAMREGILALPPIWREILVRYYGDGQPPQEICMQMGFTETKFREIKTAAKKLLDGAQG
jgi:DNA-directed RNA polymerase specialized sigma24 family protein